MGALEASPMISLRSRSRPSRRFRHSGLETDAQLFPTLHTRMEDPNAEQGLRRKLGHAESEGNSRARVQVERSIKMNKADC